MPRFLALTVTLMFAAQGAQADMALAKASGCAPCHAIDAKIVGPAWKDIAKRYQDDPTARARLIGKVKNGSRGAWTEVTGGVPMPPYPRLPDADVEKLIDFILSLE